MENVLGKIIFYSPLEGYGRWDHNSPNTTGIGGSETSHIECVNRLANRGYNVKSYVPLTNDSGKSYINNNVLWDDCKRADFNEDGIWIIYRSPDSVDNFKQKKEGQKIWIICQDVDYQYSWTSDRIEKIDKVFALCDEHAKYLAARTPELSGKIYLWGNGIKADLIEEIESKNTKNTKNTKNKNIVRNPKRLIYSSSPDRGLLTLLKIFERAKEWVSDLELHIYYGFKGIDLAIERGHNNLKKYKDEIYNYLNKPGIYFHDRIPQDKLIEEYLKSGIWCYPTQFEETSCITCMDSQALGAIPITNPYWALRDNVKWGIFIPGKSYNDELIQAKYVESIVRLATNEDFQEKLRLGMMKWARQKFNWERIVDIIEGHILLENNIYCASLSNQYLFQHRNSFGKIINIGCADDISDFKNRGATNIDVCKNNKYSGLDNKIDIIADARNLPQDLYKKFDCAILGDILEHMIDEDIIKSLKQAKECLVDDDYSHIIITVPNDFRSVKEQNINLSINDLYSDGVYAYHWRSIPKELICGLINKAGLVIKRVEKIDYGFCKGWGIICH